MISEENNANLIAFGENLKKLRTKKNLSLRQLAAACNIDHSKIGKFEKGSSNPTLLTIIDLAAGLEVHPKKLLDFEVEAE